jgi:hypothetical protein
MGSRFNAAALLCRALAVKRSVSLAYPFADAMIAVSAGVADDPPGLRRDDISVVHNPLF